MTLRKFTQLILVTAATCLVLIITGCSKDGGVCMTNTGPVISQERPIGEFDSIAVYNYVNLIISNDSTNKVTVETGQNIMAGITTRVENRQLIISNTNTCNWLRSYNKPINVYVSAKKIWKIYYASSGNINSANTLHFDSLKIEVWGGCGTIDLDLNLFKGYFILNTGTVDFKLHGYCAINSAYTGEYGKFDAGDLATAYSFITNNGSNDAYVKASEYLQGNIGNIGNIYYSGNPKIIEETRTGTGVMIPF